jgi:solute carrier family 38 (sodium-coupled neutral amino acid transporter), member 11
MANSIFSDTTGLTADVEHVSIDTTPLDTGAGLEAPVVSQCSVEARAEPADQSPCVVAKPPPKSTLFGAVSNFVNSIVGAGIIGLPHALDSAGMGAGLLLLFIIAALTVYSIQLIVKLGTSVGKSDYETLCEHAFGPRGYVVISVAMLLFAFGAMSAYMVILADTASAVIAHWSGLLYVPLSLRRSVLAVSAVCGVLPLSVVKNMSSLARASAASLGAVLWIVAIVVIRSVFGAPDARMPAGRDAAVSFVSPHIFPAIGVISCAFVCHHNSFIVFNSLEVTECVLWCLQLLCC